MKQESTRLLKKANDVIMETIKSDHNLGYDMIDTLYQLHDIIASVFSEESTNSKFNWFDCVPSKKNPYYYKIGGMHYESGFKVATDTKILVAEKYEYDADKENKTITKDCESLEGRYPDWKALFENREYKGTKCTLNVDRVNEIEKIYKANKRLDKNYKNFVNVGDAWFDAWYFIEFAKFLQEAKVNEFTICTERNGYKAVVNTENVKSILMGLVIHADHEFTPAFDYFSYMGENAVVEVR